MQGRCLCPSGFSGYRCELQEIWCQNEGTWDGLKCHCPSAFYGSRCEFAVEQVDLGELPSTLSWEMPLTLLGLCSVAGMEAPCHFSQSLHPCLPSHALLTQYHVSYPPSPLGDDWVLLLVWAAWSCISF